MFLSLHGILQSVPTGNELLTNLIAWYEMNTTNDTFPDSHTGGYDGSFPGPSTQKPDDSSGTHFTFDGSNDWCSIPDNDVFSFTDEVFSIQYWFRSSAIGGFTLYKASTTSNREYTMGTGGGGTAIGQIFNNGSTTSEYALGTTSIVDGVWHHIVFTGDGTNLKIYVDGVLEDTELINYNMGNYGSDINIGRYGGGSNYWAGDLKKLAFWDAALTSDQVLQLYNNGNGLSYGDLG